MHSRMIIAAAVTCLSPTLLSNAIADDGDWPSFRGPQASGVEHGTKTATTWNVETGENIRWKVDLPGMAHSSPVIAGDRLFITNAVRKDGDAALTVGLYGSIGSVENEGPHDFNLVCFDKNTGELIWRRTARTGVPQVKRHPKGSHAASSPATNGSHVVAFFGSEGLYCYDIDGNLKWSKDFGVLDSSYFAMPTDSQWGFASSPVIHDDLVIVQVDVIGDSFVAAFDLTTGEQRWRTPRDEVPTWSTPTVDVRDGRAQVICNGWKRMAAYDLKTGKELWHLQSQAGGDIPVPTPVVSDDLLYLTNAHGRVAPILAVKAHAAGELQLSDAEDDIAWHYADRRGNYMQTPIEYGDLIFFCSDAGIMSCYNKNTGEMHFRERLGSGQTGFTASPVAVDGKIYYTSETGEIYIVRAANEFEVITVNPMGTECMATPAISDGTIYWRTRKGLIAVKPKGE